MINNHHNRGDQLLPTSTTSVSVGFYMLSILYVFFLKVSIGFYTEFIIYAVWCTLKPSFAAVLWGLVCFVRPTHFSKSSAPTRRQGGWSWGKDGDGF